MSAEAPAAKQPKALSYAALVRAVKSAHVPNGGPGFDPDSYLAETARFRKVAEAIGEELAKIGRDKKQFLRDVWAD